MGEQQGTGSPALERMGAAFGRSARRSMRSTIIGVIGVFAMASAYFLHNRSQTLAVEQAWLAGLALQQGEPGGMAGTIGRVMARHGAIAGVSVIGETGQPTLTIPEHPSIRAAAATGLAAKGKPTRSQVEDDAGATAVWTIAVPTEEDGAARGHPLVFLLRPRPVLVPWLIGNALFAGTVFCCTRLGLRWMTRWFHCRVAEPLRRFSQTLHHADPSKGGSSRVEWSELAEVEARFHELKAALIDAEQRAERVQRVSQFEIESKQAQFTRKLRRESDKANIDALTGLRNRRFLAEELENFYDRAKGEGQDLSLAMIDLDNFKTLNDTAGHKAGDELLRFVGELLRGTSRPEDCAVRYGGDEFVVILPDTSIRHARLVSERLIKLFAQYASRDRYLRKVTMSAGVASLHTTQAQSGDELMHKADEILYTVKSRGKNAVASTGAAA
jgi:diguanylate cyclase (GGDEF)-like protein